MFFNIFVDKYVYIIKCCLLIKPYLYPHLFNWMMPIIIKLIEIKTSEYIKHILWFYGEKLSYS